MIRSNLSEFRFRSTILSLLDKEVDTQKLNDEVIVNGNCISFYLSNNGKIYHEVIFLVDWNLFSHYDYEGQMPSGDDFSNDDERNDLILCLIMLVIKAGNKNVDGDNFFKGMKSYYPSLTDFKVIRNFITGGYTFRAKLGQNQNMSMITLEDIIDMLL